ncbi:hypothetical protein I3842_08G152700 [Carya illinoinensis]|uniref:Uncharacterized protein n=1 Tax=Carya illinoinensis TaxID=32201 RepID=A0A922JE91_CARIL|nr:hypothetical protein I3842_08G152700 [Carya illinoinensis]
MDHTITDELTSLELGNVLFEKAMKGRWGEVIDICTEKPLSLVAGITRLEDTMLHLAVSSGQEEIVRKLTCLCKYIASVDPSLIGERNHEGETPLFTAVLFGKKQAFECLYDLCLSNDERYSCSRNTSTGDTILHCAISGDHFDLALRIVELYEEVLVNAVNEDGITPLHLLADKPSAFPSGSRLGSFQRIIYQCIYVDEYKMMEPDDHFFQRSMQPIERLPAYERNPNNYPENYRRCNDFYRCFGISLHFVLRLAMGINVGAQTDEENPQTHAGNQGKQPNYDVCCNFLKLANRIVLIVLGGGIPTIRKIYEEKQKHTLSIQIMNQLLQGKPSQLSDIAKDTVVPTRSKDDLQVTDPLDAIDNIHDHSEAEETEAGKKIMTKSEPETAILIAARNGVAEIVEKILELVPVAIHDVNEDNKNAVLLAVENRQPHVYKLLLQRKILNRDRVFRVVDKEGNRKRVGMTLLGETNCVIGELETNCIQTLYFLSFSLGLALSCLMASGCNPI